MFHIGRDGWLFLTGGSNDAAKLYGTNRDVWRMLRGWRRLLLTRAARVEGLGARYLHLVSPEKLSVYDRHFFGRGPVRASRSPARRLGRLVRLSPAGRRLWVDALAPLRHRRDEADLYFRTDTHWTSRGTFIAYRAVCAACGASAIEDLLVTRPTLAAASCMDLGEKLQFPVPETRTVSVIPQRAVVAERNPLHVLAERRPELNIHSGVAVGYRNDDPAADPRTLLLFGSSYSGYGETGLTAMLAETFRRVHFVWSAEIDWTLVARLRPDLVVTESAERYMARLPEDRLDLGRFQEAAVARFLASDPSASDPEPGANP